MRAAFLKLVDLLPLGVRSRLHRVPFLAWLQRQFFRALTQNLPLQDYKITAGPAAGLKLYLHFPEDKSYWKGTHELKVCQFLEQRTQPGDLCWDVGAHIGYTAVIMARKSGRHVVCFEPLPENRERLNLQQQANPQISLKILPQALGNNECNVSFNTGGDNSMGKLSDSTFEAGRGGSRIISVAQTTADAILERGLADIPSLLKIDTEGAEYRVLAGGRKMLLKHRPKILMEIHGCDEDAKLFELLKELNYRFTIIEDASQTHPKPGQHIWAEPA